MLTIFTEPDITGYPDNFQSITCPGLEIMTGADMVISRLKPNPLTGDIASPVENLDLHIANRSLFVQIKIGYDITSFDQLKSSIARMMVAKIPKGQAILLPVGDYYEKDGTLRVRKRMFFGNHPFSTLETIYDMWSFRGGTVEALPPKHIDDLQKWIDRKAKSLEKIEGEGTREIYPPSPEFVPEDIWQSVEEVDDWRKFLVSGLTGFGSAKANAIWEYAREHCDFSPYGFYRILCMLTDEIESKAVHKIPLWGDKSRKEFRGILGVPDGQNLSEGITYFHGWQSCLDQFMYMVDKEKSLSPRKIQKIFDELKKENEVPF